MEMKNRSKVVIEDILFFWKQGGGRGDFFGGENLLDFLSGAWEEGREEDGGLEKVGGEVL